MSDLPFVLTIGAIFGGLVVLLWRLGIEREKRREYDRNRRNK